MKDPLLITGVDGVGSKLKLATYLNKYFNIGIDLVAMNVNDVLCHGAQPLYFLDYYATGYLDIDIGKEIIKGISYGCELANCALVGGETAEMPTVYNKTSYDLAGFCVGAVERKNYKPNNIQAGDTVLGLESSGLHSNGFSMIDWESTNSNILKMLIEPTKIYVNSCMSVMSSLSGLVHITGGGFSNIERIIPDGLTTSINLKWKLPYIFKLIKNGTITYDKKEMNRYEMSQIFNCGIGMVLIVSKNYDYVSVFNTLRNHGESVHILGNIKALDNKVTYSYYETSY